MYFEIFSKNYILNKVLALAKSSDNPTTHVNEKRNNIYLLKVNKTRHLKISQFLFCSILLPSTPKSNQNLNLVHILPFSFHDLPTEALKRLPSPQPPPPQAPSTRHTLGLHQPGVQTVETHSSLLPTAIQIRKAFSLTTLCCLNVSVIRRILN